jgi:tripartite-type tricarboxylate transporter receptor subunit TctC
MIAEPATQAKLQAAAINGVSSTPEEFEAFFKKEAARWSKAFQESGIKLD